MDAEKCEDAGYSHGYPAYAAWMASSNDFFVLRRFSRTTARCLLYQQHRIARLAHLLDYWDTLATSAFNAPGTSRSDSIENDPVIERNKLIEQLIPMLQRYHQSINDFAGVKGRPTATSHQLQSLSNWFANYPNAITPSEQHFWDENKAFCESDLFPILSRENLPLRQMLGRWQWLRSIFRLKRTSDRWNTPTTQYTSERGLDSLTAFLVITLGLGLLFGPMWCLDFVNNGVNRLAIVTGFIALFTVLIWTAAGQRPFEILAATAAYAAVLMVFIQNNASSGGG